MDGTLDAGLDRPDIATLAARLCAADRITEGDVLELRRSVYGKPSITREDVAAIFRLQRETAMRDPAFDSFYVEALFDFFFHDRDDETLGEAEARLIMDEIGHDGRVDDATELELLIGLVHRARKVPESLSRLAHDALYASIMSGSGGPPSAPGVIDDRRVDAIRRLVHGCGSASGIAIGAEEAGWLIDLDHATRDAPSCPAWRDLFVKAVAMFILFGGGSPDCVDAGELAWLRAQLDRGRGFTANGRALIDYLRKEAASVPPGIDGLCR